MRIGEVARRAAVTRDTLRYYERLGLLEPAARTASGYRIYDPAVIDRLAFIGKAQALGLTLDEVGDVLRASAEGTPPCEHVVSTLVSRLRDVDERISELRKLRRSLVSALDRSREAPPEACVCAIIESQEMSATKPMPAHRRRRAAVRGTRKEEP